MNELSLFTGAGGGVLGTKLLGFRHIGYVEYENYCQKIIKQRIKDGILDAAPIFGDIRKFIAEGYVDAYQGMVDVVTAGFPCQPFSVAGKRKGENDERNMWSATLRCLQIIRPKYALLENVTGLLSAQSEVCLCGRADRWRRAYWDSMQSWEALLRGDHDWDGRKSEATIGGDEKRIWRDDARFKETDGSVVSGNEMAYWRGISDSIPKEDFAVSDVEIGTGKNGDRVGRASLIASEIAEWKEIMDSNCNQKGRTVEEAYREFEQKRAIRCVKCGRLVSSTAGFVRYLGKIFADLAESGYDCRWCVLGASDVGANHRRKRLWILAHSKHERMAQRRGTFATVSAGTFTGGIEGNDSKSVPEEEEEVFSKEIRRNVWGSQREGIQRENETCHEINSGGEDVAYSKHNRLQIPDNHVQTVITSPPYWGLRDYGTGEWCGGNVNCDHIQRTNKHGGTSNRPGLEAQKYEYKTECGKCGAKRIDKQLGLEKTPEEYTEKMTEIFREVRRVLKNDGTLWLNLGDSYASDIKGSGGPSQIGKYQDDIHFSPIKFKHGLKQKDLVGIPWRIAFALQQDGWYLRQDIIWSKPNPMPESVTDRCTKAHEYIFLLSKSAKYFYDADAIKEKSVYHEDDRKSRSIKMPDGWDTGKGSHGSFHRGGREKGQKRYPTEKVSGVCEGSAVYSLRNKRSVWSIATQPYPEAHFATFPKEIPRLCILAGSKAGDIVLDPFHGSGTTGEVAKTHNRKYIGIELNEDYIKMSIKRYSQEILSFS